MSESSRMRVMECKECRRRYLVVQAGSSPPLACACGASAASNVALPDGIYGVVTLADDARGEADAGALGGSRTEATTPHDHGYGAAHGYDPGHEGPSGPGDAPAFSPPLPVRRG